MCLGGCGIDPWGRRGGGIGLNYARMLVKKMGRFLAEVIS